MNRILLCSLLFIKIGSLVAQDEYGAMGIGYGVVTMKQPQFSELLEQTNLENPGLIQPFTMDDLHRGYQVWLAFKNNKTLTTLEFFHTKASYAAEGVIPAISPNSAGYKIGSLHSGVSCLIDYFPVKFIGFGGMFGISYSRFKNEQKDLIFGETNSVVDKKGGFHVGVNVILHIPLGNSAFIQVQPYYLKPIYKNEMDNLAAIYLGQNNTAPKETTISGLGANIKLGIKIQ